MYIRISFISNHDIRNSARNGPVWLDPILLSERSDIALKSIKANVKIIEFCAQVEQTQTYYNKSTSPLEAIYVFPVDRSAAICGFGKDFEI